MPHIKIRITSPSPQAGQKLQEVLQIKTPEGFLSLTETGETFSTPRDGTVVADTTSKFPEASDGQQTDATEPNQEQVCSSSVTEVREEAWEVKQNSTEETTQLDGDASDAGQPKGEFLVPRRELASFKLQLDAFKAKLEEEVIERFKLEDELKSERGVHEFESRVLREQLEEMSKCIMEKSQTIESLENALDEDRRQGESLRLEVETLEDAVTRGRAEANRLRSDVIAANDQAEEMTREIGSLRKKAENDASEKESIKKRFRVEIEDNSSDLRDMRNSFEKEKKLNEEKENTIRSLKKDIRSYQEQVEELQKELNTASDEVNSHQETGKSAQHARKSEELIAMSSELNEVYREHVETQSRMTVLAVTLNSAQREIQDARHTEAKHSFELQNYKERFNEMKDLSTALKEENRHLKNTLQRKSRDSRDMKKKYLILETEVMWLREALNIVEMSKPEPFKGGVILEQVNS